MHLGARRLEAARHIHDKIRAAALFMPLAPISLPCAQIPNTAVSPPFRTKRHVIVECRATAAYRLLALDRLRDLRLERQAEIGLAVIRLAQPPIDPVVNATDLCAPSPVRMSVLLLAIIHPYRPGIVFLLVTHDVHFLSDDVRCYRLTTSRRGERRRGRPKGLGARGPRAIPPVASLVMER